MIFHEDPPDLGWFRFLDIIISCRIIFIGIGMIIILSAGWIPNYARVVKMAAWPGNVYGKQFLLLIDLVQNHLFHSPQSYGVGVKIRAIT
jgi:hypothetical protein